MEKISSYLDDYDLPAYSLEFEVTESMLIESVNNAADVLTRLHDMGCQLSLDDFGTGYTSMQYLKSYPIDTIKIDRSFIIDVCTDEDDKTLTETIINMSHNLGKKVIAEGVEDAEQLELLRKMGCNEAQGYFIAKGMSLDDLMDWMKSYDPSEYVVNSSDIKKTG
jgi:EAL domain-containing protein (putative c-di-GMP-specific phosphodiesterase class I)